MKKSFRFLGIIIITIIFLCGCPTWFEPKEEEVEEVLQLFLGIYKDEANNLFEEVTDNGTIMKNSSESFVLRYYTKTATFRNHTFASSDITVTGVSTTMNDSYPTATSMESEVFLSFIVTNAAFETLYGTLSIDATFDETTGDAKSAKISGTVTADETDFDIFGMALEDYYVDGYNSFFDIGN